MASLLDRSSRVFSRRSSCSQLTLNSSNVWLIHLINLHIKLTMRFSDMLTITLFFTINHQHTKTFVKTLQQVLKSMKLSINDTKIKRYPKPIITELTIAKERVSSLMNSEIEPDIEEIPTTDPADAPTLDLVCDINTDRLILKYKTIIKETGVDYSSLLNYTFAIAEKKLGKILQLYTKSVPNERNQKQLLLGILAIVEFSFFTYSASPKSKSHNPYLPHDLGFRGFYKIKQFSLRTKTYSFQVCSRQHHATT